LTLLVSKVKGELHKMAVNKNSTTTIRYKVFGRDDERSMSIGTPHAATFAKRMISQHAWTSATIEDVEQNGKLQAAMNSQLPTNHVEATPSLFQLTAHSKKLESASSKRLVNEEERNTLISHALESVKALGMSRDRVLHFVNQVYGNPAPAPDVKEVPVSVDPQVRAVFSGNPAPAPTPEKKEKGGIFSR
jgi:hypothetical protein